MRDYGRVHTAFWASDDARALSVTGKLLALYLLTCHHATIVGAFRLPLAYAADDLQLEPDVVRQALDELEQRGFARYCPATRWIWVCRFLRWNRPENPNQMKAIWTASAHVPKACAWRADFQAVIDALGDDAQVAAADLDALDRALEQLGQSPPTKPTIKPLERVPEPFRNQDQDQDQDQDQEIHTTPRAREGLPFVVPYPAELYQEHVGRLAHDMQLAEGAAAAVVRGWAQWVAAEWTANGRSTAGVSNFGFWRERFREWRGTGPPLTVHSRDRSLEMRMRRAEPPAFGDWTCPHTPHCGARSTCERASALAAAKELAVS